MRVVGAILFAVLAGASARAMAQPAGAPVTEGPATTEAAASDDPAALARQAREAFDEGMRQFQARVYRDAIHSFERAARFVPSADLWFNVARAHEELGAWEPAVEAYRRYLRDRVDPPDRAQVEARIALLVERAEAARAGLSSAPTSATLEVPPTDTGARLSVDGRETATGSLTVAPGTHRVEVDAPGAIPFRADVAVDAGQRSAVHVSLPPQTRFEPTRAAPVFAWVAFGAAAASLGVSVGLGVDAGSRSATNLADARDVAAWSDAALGVGLGLATVGLVLWFVEEAAVGTARVDSATSAP